MPRGLSAAPNPIPLQSKEIHSFTNHLIGGPASSHPATLISHRKSVGYDKESPDATTSTRFGTSIAQEFQQERMHGGHPNKEGIEMDFAATLIVSNTLMAAVIYLVVTWIWED
jgi:hypothetical protein